MTNIYFIRHCQSNHQNKDDYARELTKKGLEDSKLVTAFLKDKKINKIISSPYVRTIETIKDFSEYSKLDIETRIDLREWEVNKWADNFKEYVKPIFNDMNYADECETLNSVQKRNIKELNNILKEYEGKNIAIATHGMALSMMIKYYDDTYNYDEFLKMLYKNPWCVHMCFEKERCLNIEKIDLY